ncbi:hypothetical protein HBI56_180480 [Parastagonospora nodorum]|uniref:Uncharacterized protein n=1 Tax=Phaeosphaeria nodorum (strain SN15 / ATCC MYA-4574 / FGSC 10173) TaxID=321614 RepID=A0A7U2F987_PHANO|nr:hypothetical protein HBH56_185910 [Parastagonospora nodorum]QRD01066.1 hypothetical protein JI435_153320 [Parastagonospora nodorum SN15]KAH3925300.1 hypothetical protein HBH54_182650 [Parastagonospora nodorum]KAH3962176.1 hypothetical protein HBH52_226370 [Parastagonospora nodorum]KAH4015949.1 hypothetical protein HBI09_204000 [Parastagonospora nodorum]
MCSGLPERGPCLKLIEEMKNTPEQWTLAGFKSATGILGACDGTRWPVDYCLSERAELQCSLNFSSVIASAVTALNFFKAMLMFHIVFSTKRKPIITMGDAVASFLDDRDATTTNMGPISSHDCERGYNAGATTWKDTTSKKRRTVTLVLFTAALGVIIGLMIWGVRAINYHSLMSTSDVFRFGFGAVDPCAFILGALMPNDIVTLASIANSPQILLSFMYLANNSLFTAMLMGYEWVSYAHKRKGLRTSRKPLGA